MKCVLIVAFSEPAAEVLARRPQTFRAHRARMPECRA